MEKDCKWHFGPEGGRENGPNDPVDEKFKGQPYYSIVREAIQNSLDACVDNNSPVKVEFSFFQLSRKDYPGLFTIEHHIKQCQEYYPNNDNAERLFKDMLQYLNGNEEGKKRVNLSCLRISDYNTTGMDYKEGSTESPFYAFLRAGGVSAKSQGSGGSFGFGKGAYYTLSPIKTIVVSTRTFTGEVFFEGSTILTTHKGEEGEILTAFGYYDNNDGRPTMNENDIPEIFQRQESGTDVNIIGLWDESKRKTLMIKSVLNNFWLAIHDAKLIVKVDDVTIDRSNIEQIIDDYFSVDGFESGPASEIESWNPKSYLKAVKYSRTSDRFQMFEHTLETIGKVKLYFYLERGLANRTSFFRKPRMVVFKRTSRKLNGYSAVFICDNEEGNEILRLMENPAHNEWDENNSPKEAGQTNRLAKKAKREIAEFVNDCLDRLSKIKTSKKMAFLGLEEYLSIPEDLLEKEEEFEQEGNTLNNFSGEISEDITDEETGIQTTNNTQIVRINATVKRFSEVLESEGVELDDEGAEIATAGGENEGDEGFGKAPHPEGDGLNTGNRTDHNQNKSKVVIVVRFRVAAQIQDGTVYHYLIINSPTHVQNAELELLVNSDNDGEGSVDIIETTSGSISKNILKGVTLDNGLTKIRIRFADNIKHSIKLKTYEIR
ncbi:MAG TPA: hypothetical protein VK183_04820 [Flavobacterium sp.]|nr:hypothetical protein [Flavobacterium sp.]